MIMSESQQLKHQSAIERMEIGSEMMMSNDKSLNI
jgi:hypothetical protein